MNRQQQRAALNRRWWGPVLVGVLPWGVLAFSGLGWNVDGLKMPVFILGLLSLFVSLKAFAGYKRALWALREQDEAGEAGRWQVLDQTQARGLLWASLPAWVAAVGSVIGLEGIAGLLLVLSSAVIYCLYRIPAQVVLP